MTILEYMQSNPWMTFFIILGLVSIIVNVFRYLAVICVGRWPETNNENVNEDVDSI